jgi:5-methylcytosine-specific restriction endonuclease McrA
MAHSEETKRKIREAWIERRKTFVSPTKGKRLSDETRQKMSEAAKQRGSNRTGKYHTAETRMKISQTARERKQRQVDIARYTGRFEKQSANDAAAARRRWRFDVFARDDFTCQQCGDTRGYDLVAHPIKPVAEHPELRYEVSNGITLCGACYDALRRAASSKVD